VASWPAEGAEASGTHFGGGAPRGARSFSIGPLTVVLIALSVIVAVLSKLGADRHILRWLFITIYADTEGHLPVEIAHGEVWRLLTPIFIHFGIMHLVFNLLWLKELGTAIEMKLGTMFLLTFVLVTGVISNIAQLIYAGPIFGGMSGVVYGLLGFVWMKSKFDPGSGFYLDRQTVIMMLGWFVLCAVNIIPHVANGAHGAGLALGIIWGFIAAKAAARGRRVGSTSYS
jgi:GlpG protein